MNTRLVASYLVAGALLLPITGNAGDLASNETLAKTYVKDSVIRPRSKPSWPKQSVKPPANRCQHGQPWCGDVKGYGAKQECGG